MPTYGNLNVDTVTTGTAGGILGAGNASIMKNRIINGDFKVSQYNGTSSVTPSGNAYIIDRYRYIGTQTSKFTFQQLTTTPPTGFTYYLGATVASAVTVGAGDYFFLCQRIEGLNSYDLGWGTANAKTVTLSFQVYSSLTGTFGGTIQNGPNTYSYPFTYSIPTANTWTTISITVAGPTAGAWVTNTDSNIQVNFGLGAGSTYSGTAGSWSANQYYGATGAVSVVGTASAVWNVTAIQLEVGSSATGYEYRLYNQELSACQRYYWQAGGTSANETIGNGTAYSTNWCYAIVKCPITMRTTPSVTKLNTWNWNDYVAAGIGTGALTLNTGNSSKDYLFLESQATTSGLTQYRTYYLTAANSTSAILQFSAEL